MPIDAKIGYVSSNDSYNMIRYSFESCDSFELIREKNPIVSVSGNQCDKFKIDSNNGLLVFFK